MGAVSCSLLADSSVVLDWNKINSVVVGWSKMFSVVDENVVVIDI